MSRYSMRCRVCASSTASLTSPLAYDGRMIRSPPCTSPLRPQYQESGAFGHE
jgi:hypothetical protein